MAWVRGLSLATGSALNGIKPQSKLEGRELTRREEPAAGPAQPPWQQGCGLRAGWGSWQSSRPGEPGRGQGRALSALGASVCGHCPMASSCLLSLCPGNS